MLHLIKARSILIYLSVMTPFPRLIVYDNPFAAANTIRDTPLLSIEFMYQAFGGSGSGMGEMALSFALRSRLDQLSAWVRPNDPDTDAAVLLICDSIDTARSFHFLQADYPRLKFCYGLANPEPQSIGIQHAVKWKARRYSWEDADQWRIYDMSDRWARILFALRTCAVISNDTDGYVLMPALDSVWGDGLIDRLIGRSEVREQSIGRPTAVSPFTPFQHSPIPDCTYEPSVIDVMNACYNRDSTFPAQVRDGTGQAFWGKMSLTPYKLCEPILNEALPLVMEDDRELDGAVARADGSTYGDWIDDPTLYRQSPPIFDMAGVEQAVFRTMHYTADIPGNLSENGSIFCRPLSVQAARMFPKEVLDLSQSLINRCVARIEANIRRYGVSWVDWGRYRYVVEPGNPQVAVWSRGV